MATQTNNGRAFEWAVGLVLKLQTNMPIAENAYSEINKKPFHEQSFVFKVHSHSLSKNKEVISKEQHLTFHWEKFSNLAHKNFLPTGMYDFLKEYEEQKQPKFLSLIKDQFTTNY
ncbi:hypothetical protein [Candidatus Tisiphia endosymbiont of Temnostethus pusillus]|uniref:hypothetical protein n=1 Tax=Candidatus Tisiphia endosymbiont of Temnostethus pusillus TaxID=3139335 RepID=UPI0035C91E55